jgi:YggT family protein
VTFVLTFICILLEILRWAIIGRAIVSWIPNIRPDNPIVVVLNEITEPIIAPFRQIIPRAGMVDITPLVVLIMLWFLTIALCR